MTSRAGLLIVVALAAMVTAGGAFAIVRPGYTPDEEFTLFAVRGIAAHGLPLLPSGLLYDRGLLYSYLSWAVGLVSGAELPAFRALSLLSGAATLVLGYRLVRRLSSVAAGVAAAALVSASLPFWAAVTTGRFYAPFLLTCIAALFVASARPRAPLFIVSLVARLLHELAFTLVAIPVAALALSYTGPRSARESPRGGVMVAAAVLAGLGAAQALLMGLHFLIPPAEGGGTMIRRFFLWQVLNLFERPAGAPLGVVISGIVLGVLVAPSWAGRIGRAGAAAAAATIAGALIYDTAVTAAWPSLQHALDHSLAYPLDMFWHLATAHPVMVWTGLGLLAARLFEAGGDWPIRERAAHLGWVGWVLWFGVVESGITINYELLPSVCLLTAIALDLVAIAEHTRAIWPGPRAQAVRAALVGVALAIVADQWRGSGPLRQRLIAARPTISIAGLDAVRSTLAPGDRVACTDELACLLLVGRVDAWLALDDYVRERFLVERGATRVGVYAGAPALFTPAELLSPDAAGRTPARVIVVDVFKEYPIGNSRTWLPRAMGPAHLDARTLLETPQARVVEVRERRQERAPWAR